MAFQMLEFDYVVQPDDGRGCMGIGNVSTIASGKGTGH